ncbi:MAG: YggS family pyridoxal phosphate-dependent enzyme [Verrucomicrobia bacterium]|nr:YggS family pyridoxal phosphate-dependent enzyme [Verrucomicrobiota bacterium]
METSFEERWTAVQARINSACGRCGRDPSCITLVAVSKTRGPEEIAEAADCGLIVFGESKVQEAEAKIPRCPGQITWHLIGHLQRNKVRRAVRVFDMIHSVDSVLLLESVEAACAELGKIMPIFVEVNVSGEPAKFGVNPDDLQDLLESTVNCPHIEVRGLMTMPPWSDDPEKARGHFRELAGLKTRCETEWGFPLADLSMGMSHDFEVAIEEGATYIRVGTDLFGPRRG